MFQIQKNFQNARVARTVRFPETLFEELGRTAAEENLSVNRLILLCCAYALGERGALGLSPQIPGGAVPPYRRDG